MTNTSFGHGEPLHYSSGIAMTGGGYVNYGAPDEPVDRVRAAYGDAIFERLRQAKRRYDPDNLFRINHNVPPAEA